jgi:hypothetical protein
LTSPTAVRHWREPAERRRSCAQTVTADAEAQSGFSGDAAPNRDQSSIDGEEGGLLPEAAAGGGGGGKAGASAGEDGALPGDPGAIVAAFGGGSDLIIGASDGLSSIPCGGLASWVAIPGGRGRGEGGGEGGLPRLHGCT